MAGFFETKTLRDAINFMVCKALKPFNDPPRALYHYTKDEAKIKIMNEKKELVFRFTQAKDFLDKNEGAHIFEPYYHACGKLFNDGKISKLFYEILTSIKREHIVDDNNSPWILCFTSDGYSKKMKERYAPSDGWLISFSEMAMRDLEKIHHREKNDKNSQTISYNKVEYSCEDKRKELEEIIVQLYNCFQNEDNEYKTIDDKIEALKHGLGIYLKDTTFFYKGETYKDEKEIRIVIFLEDDFTQWKHPEQDISLIIENDKLYLKLGAIYFRENSNNIDIYNAYEINKWMLKGYEIQVAMKKLSKKY